MSEEDYNNLVELLYLVGISEMYESIVEGTNTPLENARRLNGNSFY